MFIEKNSCLQYNGDKYRLKLHYEKKTNHHDHHDNYHENITIIIMNIYDQYIVQYGHTVLIDFLTMKTNIIKIVTIIFTTMPVLMTRTTIIKTTLTFIVTMTTSIKTTIMTVVRK